MEYSEQLPLFPELFMFSQFSPSKLKVLQKCPLQYYLKYIVKYTPEITPTNDTTARDAGKTLHSILELAVKGIELDKAVSASKEINEIDEAFWEANVAPHLENVETFLTKLEKFNNAHGIVKIQTELKVGVTRDWKKTTFFDPNVFMRGVIDLLLVGTDRAFIIDHKKGGNSEWGLKNYMDQLNVYKPFTLALYPDIEFVAAGIHFIEEGAVSLEPDFSPKEHIVKSIIPLIEYNVSEAEKAVRETGYFKHYRGPHCKYCDFNDDCSAKKLLTLEKESANILNGG